MALSSAKMPPASRVTTLMMSLSNSNQRSIDHPASTTWDTRRPRVRDIGYLLREIRRSMQRIPHPIPLDANMRGEAHQQQALVQRAITLAPIKVNMHLNKGHFRVEPIKLMQEYQVAFLIDTTADAVADLLDHKGSIIDSGCISPGFGQMIVFTIKFKKFPSNRLSYRVVMRAKQDSEKPTHQTFFSLTPSKDGLMTIRMVKQSIVWEKKEYEMLEIYGQSQDDSGKSNLDSANSNHPQGEVREKFSDSFISINIGSDEHSGGECVICLTEPRDTLFLPCRHMCICLGCAQTLGTGDGKCPLCRQTYQSILTLKFSDGKSALPHCSVSCNSN